MGSSETTKSKTLQCGIIGAGIAGLSAAIALRRAGHDVEVFERSAFKNEIGAAITLCPNANLILDSWGFKRNEAGATAKKQLRRLQWDTLEVQYQQSLDHVEGKYGYAFDAFHRVDLHKSLRDLAAIEHSTKIRLGREVTDVECEKGIIKFADGETVQKDLVVVADGIRSQLTSKITGRENESVTTWGSFFRAIIPIDRFKKDETIWPIFNNEPSGFLTSSGNQKVSVITYPCRDETMMNIAVLHPTLHHLQDNTGWSNPASIDDVLRVVDGWPEFWKSIIKQADPDAFKVYRVDHRSTIPTMVNGRTCIMGDSAHGMMPTYGQGGGMAIEDAAALGVLFSDFDPSDQVEDRLKLWNHLRLPRTAVLQIISNRSYRDISDRDHKVAQFYKGALPASSLSSWSDQWNDVLFKYDILKEAQKLLQYRNTPDDIPYEAVNYFGPYDPLNYREETVYRGAWDIIQPKGI